MTDYQPGQRIRLVHTNDPHTRLRPGDTGTVRRHHRDTSTVDIAWDSGSHLSMLLDSGDRIAVITDPGTPTTQTSTPQAPDTALSAARSAGSAAGRDAADWWGQHTVGGRATGDVRPAARQILAGIDDGDPAVLDGLPMCNRSDYSLDLPHLLHQHGQPGGPQAQALTSEERENLYAAYADAYDEAAEARVVELCHLAASPTGTDLSHLHPDRVQMGSVGVFSGEWAITHADDGDRYSIGFVGTLVGRWNGWAVFACTRAVADAIIADHDTHRRTHRDRLNAAGVSDTDLDTRLDADMARLSFDGDVLVADLRALQDDPDAIERVHPGADGRYTVMGGIWCWEPVDPYECDQVVGDIPEPDDEHPHGLRHTPQLLLPHDRLRLANMRLQQTRNGAVSTGALLLDGLWAATVTHDANGTRITDYSPYAGFGRQGMRAYLAGCRLNGAPVTEQRLLAALADEHRLDNAIGYATRACGTQVRLVNDTGHTRAVRPLIPAPGDYNDLLRAARTLAATLWPPAGGQSWQVWTGTRWTTLPNLHGPSSPRKDS